MKKRENKREKVKESLNMIMVAVVLIMISTVLFLIGELCDADIIVVDSKILDVLLSVAAIFISVASILEILDAITMRKINRFFKLAFLCAIWGLVLSLVASGFAFLPENLKFIYEIIELVAMLFEISVFYFYIAGIRKIHKDDGDKDMIKFGNYMELKYIGSVLIGYLLSTSVIVTANLSPVACLISSVCSVVFHFAAYIVCLSFLHKSKKSISHSRKRITN